MVARFARLMPFGPIFGKELRVASRRRRNYILRVLYLIALLLILLLTYATVGDVGGGGIAAAADRQARLGSSFFSAFTFFSIVAMAAIGPVLTSTAIGAERTHKTLHVLLMTPMSAWQIVSGKLASRLLLAYALLGLSLPVLALVRLLGGVEVWQMVAAMLIAGATGAFAAAVGLWLSTMITRAYAVILASYGLLAILYLFVPFITGLATRGSGNLFMLGLGAANPVYSGMVIVFGGRGAGFGGPAPPWWLNVVTHSAGALILLALSARTLRRQQRRDDRTAAAHQMYGYTAEPLPAVESTATDPGADATAPPPRAETGETLRHRAVGNNPILWRELRQPVFARGWLRTIVRCAVVVVFGLIYVATGCNEGLDDRGSHIGFAILFNAIFWLLSAVLSATAIAQEKESDTWTTLLTTPLSGRTIVLGKLTGLLWRLRWPATWVVAHMLFFASVGVLSWTSAVLVIGVILCFNAPWIATGLYLSLRMNKVTVAVVVNLLLAVVLYLGVTLTEVAAWETFDRTPDGGPASLLALPYWYLGTSIDSFSREYALYRLPRMPGPFSAQLDQVAFFWLTLLACAVHLAVAAGIVCWTIVRFDRIVERAPGS